jgi:hypothetical protein
LDKHTGWNQRALGGQLGKDVSRYVVVTTDVMELDPQN